MKLHSVHFLSAGLIALPLLASMALAQTGTGTVSGTVRDPNRAVVPGADITITNSDTNVSRKTVSSDLGVYYFGALPLGPYSLTVELTGFKKWLGKFELQVGQNAVVDPVLQVGDIQTTVEVSGAAPPIPTETMGSTARYSRPATVTLATRTGTNQLHGTLFETHRNNGAGLLARKRDDPPDNKAPHLVRNEFGASAGGPLFLGPLYNGHDKTFWFASYEGLRQREQNFTIYTTTPTEAMWNGDLSNMVDTDGNKWTVYDPLTTAGGGKREPFPGNIIPGSRISPFAKLLKTLTAPPTNDTNPHLGSNFEKYYPDKTDRDNITVKGDHNLTAKDRLSVRWTRSTSHNAVEGGVYGAPITPEAGVGTSRSDATVNNVSINYTRTLSPSLLNELLVGV